MGIAIIILTIIIRMAVFPLTSLSYRSFAKMKKVAPQIAELKKDHGDDKARLQQEIIAMYQREGVNPMAGCFPIILQIPIFFALYKVFFPARYDEFLPVLHYIHYGAFCVWSCNLLDVLCLHFRATANVYYALSQCAYSPVRRKRRRARRYNP